MSRWDDRTIDRVRNYGNWPVRERASAPSRERLWWVVAGVMMLGICLGLAFVPGGGSPEPGFGPVKTTTVTVEGHR